MKMLVVVIFIISFVSIHNATSTIPLFFQSGFSSSTESVVSTTSQTKELRTLRTPLPESSDEDAPIEEIKICAFKYGVPAGKRQFPYVAFLKSRNDFQVKYCSGSLIHASWVFTSAFCTFPDARVEVTLGALVPFDDRDPDRVVVESDGVYIHPGYLPLQKEPKNDLALIKLSRLVKSDAISPIALKTDYGPTFRDNIVYAGWGEVGYETMTYSKNILILEGPCECRDIENLEGLYKEAPSNLELFCCISEEYYCFIHNGGGLVIEGGLVAIMSARCFKHCRGHEGTYTNIQKHHQWIKDTLNSVPKSCSDISGSLSGVNLIQPNENVEPFEVYCEILNGEKWTVIQQRFNATIDFYRGYASYTDGFGPLTGNHWLGLEKIHQLTKNGDHILRVEVETHNSKKTYAQYRSFKVDSAQTGYMLFISGYSGTAGDAMTPSDNYLHLNEMKFSTFDYDQDKAQYNCAEHWRGAWWNNWCMLSNLNGPYYNSAVQGWDTMCWNNEVALKTARMLIRRK